MIARPAAGSTAAGEVPADTAPESRSCLPSVLQQQQTSLSRLPSSLCRPGVLHMRSQRRLIRDRVDRGSTAAPRHKRNKQASMPMRPGQADSPGQVDSRRRAAACASAPARLPVCTRASAFPLDQCYVFSGRLAAGKPRAQHPPHAAALAGIAVGGRTRRSALDHPTKQLCGNACEVARGPRAQCAALGATGPVAACSAHAGGHVDCGRAARTARGLCTREALLASMHGRPARSTHGWASPRPRPPGIQP